MSGDDQAYPIPFVMDGNRPEDRAWSGLTKREYFAVAALQGILGNSSSDVTEHFGKFPKTAVEIADALIAELNKKESTA